MAGIYKLKFVVLDVSKGRCSYAGQGEAEEHSPEAMRNMDGHLICPLDLVSRKAAYVHGRVEHAARRSAVRPNGPVTEEVLAVADDRGFRLRDRCGE